MQSSPIVRRGIFGAIIIESILAVPPARFGFEKRLLPAVEVGLSGWERAHSQGAITGVESPHAIRYAPAKVNQAFQRLGIEAFLRELLAEKRDDVQFKLTTVTRSHPGTLRLKEIEYKVEAMQTTERTRLFEASIEISDSKTSPRVTIQIDFQYPRTLWQRFLKPQSRRVRG